jgi:hypothetical protein
LQSPIELETITKLRKHPSCHWMLQLRACYRAGPAAGAAANASCAGACEALAVTAGSADALKRDATGPNKTVAQYA